MHASCQAPVGDIAAYLLIISNLALYIIAFSSINSALQSSSVKN